MKTVLCLCALSLLTAPARTPARWDTCVEVVEEAQAQGVPAHVALAVALVESRLNSDAVSPAGAMGAIQVLPRWHCPEGKAEGCDLVKVGVSLLATLYLKYDSWDLAWCHYSAGTRCTERGRKYAQKVRGWAVRLMPLLLMRGYGMVDEGLRPPRRLP